MAAQHARPQIRDEFNERPIETATMGDAHATDGLGRVEPPPASGSAPEPRANRPRIHGEEFALGFVSGFVDAAGYLALFGLFSANMTGNILLLGVELVEPRGEIALNRLVAVPLFMIGVLLAWGIAVRVKRRSGRVVPVLMAVETAGLLLFAVVGTVFGPQLQHSSQQLLIVAISVCSVVAMGLQSGLAREISADTPTTTAMTNNLSLLMLEGAAALSAWLSPQKSNSGAEAGGRFLRVGRVFVGFLVGAAAGALGMRLLGYPSVGVPVIVLGLMAVRRWRTGPC